jgi:CRP-like cAMP-binding protein
METFGQVYLAGSDVRSFNKRRSPHFRAGANLTGIRSSVIRHTERIEGKVSMRIPEKIVSMFRREEEALSQRKLHYLTKTDIFCDLSPEELQEVAHAATMTTCPPGRIFYSPNERGEVLFILKKGHVQLYRMSDEGRKLVIATLGPGTVFGEMAMTGLGMYDAFAEATEEALICILNRSDLEKLLIAKPKIAMRLLDVMAKRLRETEDRLEQTLFHDVSSRLAALLLRLQTETHSDVIEMTHEELAEHLGVYRETVTAALNQLCRDDLISVGRKQVHLTNTPGLQKKASR